MLTLEAYLDIIWNAPIDESSLVGCRIEGWGIGVGGLHRGRRVGRVHGLECRGGLWVLG